MICTKCGATLGDGVIYCVKCGNVVEKKNENLERRIEEKASFNQPKNITAKLDKTGNVIIIAGWVLIIVAAILLFGIDFGGDFYDYAYKTLQVIQAGIGVIIIGLGMILKK